MAFHAHRLIRSTLAVSWIALLGISCSSVPVRQTAGEGRDIPLELHWVESSAEYRALCLQTYALAEERLQRLAEGRKPGSWAVSLDADETVLWNTRYQDWLAVTGEVYTRASWEDWVLQEEAMAVPGAKAFLERIHDLGGTIAIVTNRRIAVCDATVSNLETLELPFDLILCRDEESSKESRWQRIQDGRADSDFGPLEIVMFVGDNIHDFPGWGQSRRGDPDGSFVEFGSRFFVLPNPLYGSWEDNPR